MNRLVLATVVCAVVLVSDVALARPGEGGGGPPFGTPLEMDLFEICPALMPQCAPLAGGGTRTSVPGAPMGKPEAGFLVLLKGGDPTNLTDQHNVALWSNVVQFIPDFALGPRDNHVRVFTKSTTAPFFTPAFVNQVLTSTSPDFIGSPGPYSTEFMLENPTSAMTIYTPSQFATYRIFRAHLEPESCWWLWIVIWVLVLLLLITGLFVYGRRRKPVG